MVDHSWLRSNGLRRSVVFITIGSLLVVAGIALIVTKATSSDEPDPVSLASADRVLQSVQVTMAPNGDLTAVNGSVVGTTTGKKQFTGDSEYSPESAASDLPVRVLTSYRTAKKSGSDLSELAGYDGPVQIQLTVQNLTVKPRTLTYDVDGTERSRTAMVGAPLTIVASTALHDVKPSAVRRQAGGGLKGTNGVLSQSEKGTTQVQWASILAPPQLSSTSTLTLSVNAHDFKVPDIDLSVEPGVVTDASVGALLDQAFNPSDSSQMQLEQRTIDLVTRVNAVLARAGTTINQVRSTLNDSAKTLGTKTVADLKSSATSITSSVQGLDSSVTSLGQDLADSLSGTRSTTVEQLQQMVRVVDQMLGDTSAKPASARLAGRGCEAAVPGIKKPTSVYGNLLEVVGQLDGYARATSSCKDAMRASILKTVGPAQPDAQSCVGAGSVTCALFNAGSGFREIASQLIADGETAVASLHPEAADNAVTAAGELATASQDVATATAALAQSGPVRGGADMNAVRHALSDAVTAATGVSNAISTVHQQATTGQAGEAALGGLNSDLATQICAMVSSGALTGPEADQLRAYVSTTSCPDNNGATTQLPGAPGGRQPMEQQISAQSQAWSDLAANTATGSGTTALALAQLGTDLAAVSSAIDALANASRGNTGDLRALVAALGAKVGTLTSSSAKVTQRVGDVKQQQDGLADEVRKAFKNAADNSRSDADSAVDPSIRQVIDRTDADSAALGAMFDRSRNGLSSAAKAIADNGAKAVDQQRSGFATRQRTAGAQISSSIGKGLNQVTRGVSASTLDMKAADTLLGEDLQSVLLDLGTKRVKGSGLLGSMATGAAIANSAGYQLSLASRTASSYSNVRQGDVAGLLLRQAQTEAAAKLEAALPAFRLKLPDSATHRTVYTFHVQGEE